MTEDSKYYWWQICNPWQEVIYGRFKPRFKRVISTRLNNDPFGNWRYSLAIF